MRYEAYENRIKKLARVLSVVLRYTVVFVIALIVICLAVAGLLRMKGTILRMECPDIVAYGEDLSPDAAAFLSSVHYQYRTDDGEWNERVPVLPGEYRVRAVARRSFGGLEYSKELTFTIVKREASFFVCEDYITYGDIPSVSADLAYGDSLAAVDYIYGDYVDEINEFRSEKVIFTEVSLDVTPDAEKIRITNSAGEDVTDFYNIKCVTKNIGIVKRNIKITVEKKSKEYDGLELAWDKYDITEGELASGDLMVAVFSSSIVLEGSVKNIPEIYISNAKGEKVNRLYNLEISEGELSVVKRSLCIETTDGEWTFDGKIHEKIEYRLVSGSLLEGHRLMAIFHKPVYEASDEPTENVIYFRILDEKNHDVSIHYSVIVKTGSLKVNRCPINVKIPDFELTYDGQIHSYIPCMYFNEEDGVSDVWWYDYSNSFINISNVGIYNSAGFPVKVFSDTGEMIDLTSNFDISVERYGDLIIKKRVVTFKTGYYSKEYDGNRYQHPDWNGCIVRGETLNGISDQGLGIGHTFVAQSTVYEKNVGSYKNTMFVNIVKLVDNVGTGTPFEDVTDNYEIVIEEGIFEIVPRKVLIMPSERSKVYDGTPLFAVGEFITENLLPQHDLTASVSGSITDVYESGRVSSIVEETVKITDMFGIDVTDNYDINCLTGFLNITPRPITVYTRSLSAVYDGERHEIHELDERSFKYLLEGHEIKYQFSPKSFLEKIPKGKSFGSAANSLDKTKTRIIRTEDGGDMTGNYNITYKFGLLTLLPRVITVSTPSGSWMYDGKPHSLPEFTHLSGELLDGHFFGDPAKVDMGPTEIVHAGTIDNKFVNLIIFSDTGEDVSCNYKIVSESGTLTVEPRPIVIVTDSATKQFDGKPLTAPGAKIHSESEYDLIDGDIITLIESTRVVFVTDGVRYNVPERTPGVKSGWSITDKHGEDVTDCYTVRSVYYGTLEVTKCPIEVVTPSYERYYDGSDLSCVIGEINGGPDGDYYAILGGTPTIKRPGSIENTCDPSLTRIMYKVAGNGEFDYWQDTISDVTSGLVTNVTDNFEIVGYKFGRLTIRDGILVYVKISPTEIIYSGSDVKINFEEVTSGYQDRFNIDFSAIDLSINKVGTISYSTLLANEYKAVVTPKDPNDKNVYGVRFVMDASYPVLRVIPRSITITAASATFNYSQGVTYTLDSCSVTFGSLAPGHRLEATCTGKLVCSAIYRGELKTSNEIGAWKIIDSHGNDVTSYYNVTIKSGILQLVNSPELE